MEKVILSQQILAQSKNFDENHIWSYSVENTFTTNMLDGAEIIDFRISDDRDYLLITYCATPNNPITKHTFCLLKQGCTYDDTEWKYVMYLRNLDVSKNCYLFEKIIDTPNIQGKIL